jgi:glycosyltransferase involved in cell wall biosynthesis
MKIDILCGASTSSQNGVTPSDLYGKNDRIGVGGSEYALLTLCEAWHKRGDEVTLYNNPKRNDGLFEQRTTDSFDKNAERDILIVNREPNEKAHDANGKRIFFSCDQYTIGDFRTFALEVEKVVGISLFHVEHLKYQYNINEAIFIDLPVRSWEYETKLEKVKNRLIFTSVPERGLELLAKIWPQLLERVPDISLVITSDYRLWGCISPLNEQHVARFIGAKGVTFLGAVPRERLIKEQLLAQIHLYTNTYDELFCISVAESQVAGVLPITSDIGALATTNMGILIHGNPADNLDAFVEKTVESLQNKSLEAIQFQLSQKAKDRFSIDRILREWDERVFA